MNVRMFVDWWKLYIYLEFYKFNLISIFIFQIRRREWYRKLIFLKNITSISYNYFE